jgi:uncharacterized heparinase superfamily protein
MLSPQRFRFLNSEHEISEAGDWNDKTRTKLWLYNLHYFDDLNSRQAIERRDWHKQLIRRWICENPPGIGCGWEAYPTSIRIVNWVKYFLDGNSADEFFLQSLAIQTRYLSRHLEWHLLGNHLFSNGKALVFAGCLFHGNEASKWLNLGMKILESEIRVQILADGGHFERSPMYHTLILEDILDLINLSRAFPDATLAWREMFCSWIDVVKKMRRWLDCMTHPDGEISFFNDAAIGIASSPADIDLYLDRLGISVDLSRGDISYFEESGYLRIDVGPAALIIDLAQIGPDHLTCHSHADNLSYELSLYGQRVIVNSGTSCYGSGSQREWERSTAAHNTVEINGQSSSEVWAGFRVAGRAYPFDIVIRRFGGAIVIEGAHDGYRRLPERNVHRRRWIIDVNCLEVQDFVEGNMVNAVAKVYFHPNARIAVAGSDIEVGLLGHQIYCKTTLPKFTIENSFWYPEFGIKIPNKCIKMEFSCLQGIPPVGFRINWN